MRSYPTIPIQLSIHHWVQVVFHPCPRDKSKEKYFFNVESIGSDLCQHIFGYKKIASGKPKMLFLNHLLEIQRIRNSFKVCFKGLTFTKQPLYPVHATSKLSIVTLIWTQMALFFSA